VVAGATLAVLVCGPFSTAASAAPVSLTAASTYGGSTGQDYPVVFDLNSKKRKIVRALTVLDLTCTSGEGGNISDGFTRVTIRKNRTFSVVWGPETQRNADGTTTDFGGSLTGKLNKAKTKISGTWQYVLTDYDTAGAVTDSCDSGPVRFVAKQ
jgi:hypothetical protein